MAIIVPAPEQYADVSQWQTSFDPSAYPYRKISLRATFGTTGTDPTFAARWQAAAGFTRQAYDFAYPGDGVAAAQHFLDVVNSAGGFKPGDEAMLDLEQLGVTPQQAAQIAPAWCRTVQAAEPSVRVLVYGNEWFIAAAQLTPDELPNVGLIVASYGAPPVVPPGWPHVCVWQYADNQPVPGFPAPVDINQVICPSGLSHLTIGDDMAQADVDAINAHVDQALQFWFSNLIGKRTQPASIDPKTVTTLAALADGQYVAYHGIQNDPTHPGFVDAFSRIGDVKGAMADLQAHVATSGGADPALVAKIDALSAQLEQLPNLSWTVTTATPKAAQ